MIGSSSKFVVATNGNVGIGTAAPAQRLHVVGDVAVDGNIISGSGTGGSLSAGQVNAVSQFNIDGARILAAPGTANLIAEPERARAHERRDNAFFGADAARRTQPDNRMRSSVSRRARRMRSPRATPSSDRALAD